MEEIASRAGVTKPVLYQHFPSKRALFIDLLEDLGQRLLHELTGATDIPPTGQQRLQDGFRAYYRFVVSNRDAFRVLFGASAHNDAGFADVVARNLDEIAEVVGRLIDTGGGAEQRRVLTHALIGIAEATSRDALADDGSGPDPDVLARWVSSLVWPGLRRMTALR